MGTPCFPQSMFLGPFLFSSELKDFLETAWVLRLEGPEVTDRWESLLRPAEPGSSVWATQASSAVASMPA